MDLGWEPKTSMDLLDSTQVTPVQAVQDLREVLSEIFKDTQASYIATREQQRNRIRSNYSLPT